MDSDAKLQKAIEEINQLKAIAKENASKANYLEKLLLSLEDLQIFVCQKNEKGNYLISYSEGKIAERNRIRTENIGGCLLEELIDHSLFSILKPYYDKAFNGETVKHPGFMVEDHFYSLTLTPLSKDENGRITEILGHTQDITEAFLSEKETRKKTEIFENIIENNPFSIQVLNSEGRHVRSNSAFLEMFKAEPDQSWSIFNDPLIINNGLIANVEKVFRGEVVKMPPFWYNAHLVDPKYPDMAVCLGSVIFPVLINDKKMETVVVMHEDITTRVLAEEELIKAKEKAEEADRLKSAFLANMSHDIRTPMNGVLGFAELLKNPKLTDEKQAKYIEIIQQSGARLLNIINDLVNISKLESGQMEVVLTEVDINESFNYILNFFEPETNNKGLKLIAHFDDKSSTPIITTDKEKFLAIFTNLVKNALKFTKKGQIDFGYEKQNERMVFFVKDTGIGISENQQKIIFDRFVQADHGDEAFNEGSGLGLSISKAYIELLGGEIWFNSIKGLGTSFYFTLAEKNSINTEEHSSIDNEQTKSTKPLSLNILAVDDDDISLMFLANALEGYCKKIYLANSGKEALEQLLAHPNIDIILMDIKMPDMNGLRAAKEIKKLQSSIKIIAQTAYALEIDHAKYMEAFDEYVTKPIKIDDLKSKIESLILVK